MSSSGIPSSRPVVQLEGVSKRWPARRVGLRGKRTEPQEVLNDVDLIVGEAQVYAVLGENGAGKTTLLKVIAGLAREDRGVVTLLGETAPDRVDDFRRSRVAYSAGERGFYFRMSVRENLRFFASLDGFGSKARDERVLRAIDSCDLSSSIDRRFSDLSSGLRQRVAIARALLVDADLLLLDEPTRTIDPLHALLLRTFIRDDLAKERKRAIIVATNQLEEAHFLGDAAGIIRNTKLIPIFGPSDKPDHIALEELFPEDFERA